MGEVWAPPVLCPQKWVGSVCRGEARDSVLTHHLSPAGGDLSLPQIAHCRGAGQDSTPQPCHPAPSLPRHCAPGRGGVRASFLPRFIPSPHCILSPRLVSWSPWGLALAGAGEPKGDVVPRVPVFGFSLGIFSLASVAAACGTAASAEKGGEGST